MGAALPRSLAVRVVDRHGGGVAGVAVQWVVTGGGGSLAPVSASTDAAGNVDTGSQLQRALRVLAEQGGPAAVTARSMQLRMSTYALLANLSGTTAERGQA